MKRISIFLALIFVVNNLFSMCSFSGMNFYPEQKEISLNSMFIIEGYAFSQKTILSFKKRKVYLESENGTKVQLQLQGILEGQMQQTQAIFKSEKNLVASTNYYLKYSNETEEETKEMFVYNASTNEREKVYWRTSDKDYNTKINFDLKIDFQDTKVIYYGCGPSANATFNISNKSNIEVWYKTEVLEIKTNKKITYYIQDRNDQLYVGHGMCSGAFIFKKMENIK